MSAPFSWGLQPDSRGFGYVFRAQLHDGITVRHVAAIVRPGVAVGLKRDRTRARVFADSLPRHDQPPRREEIL